MPSATDRADRSRDLLLGVIALQMNFIDQAQFVEVMTLLPSQPGKGAGELFAAKGYLAPFQIAALEGLIDAQLRFHEGDVERSMAAWEGATEVGRSLELVGAKRPAPASGVDLEEPATMVHSRVETPPTALPPSRSDRYVVGRELGRGGLGRVVLALDRDMMDREVAMKLLLPDPRAAGAGKVASGAPLERFLDEAQITSQLQHPNVVAIYDIGTRPGGEAYYTMPVVSGRSLRDRLRDAHARLAKGELAPDAWGVERLEILGMFQGLCHGLSYAHARGVIHRDVKPANVMVGDHGETILVDWGMAKVLRKAGAGEEEPGQSRRSDVELERYIRSLRGRPGHETVEGTIAGTPAYMAPEQAEGRIAEIDERTDIYALGAVLFEILTGRPPFVGPAKEILFQVMAGSVPDLRQASSHAPVPEDVAAVCLKAMRTAKAERHPSVKVLLRELTVAIEGGKERERNHVRCEEKLASARRLVREYHELREVIRTSQVELEGARASVTPWERYDGTDGSKDMLLARELGLEEARWLATSAFNAALVALAEALAFEGDHRGARRELAEFHYFHMVEAERERSTEKIEFHRAQASLYDDGGLVERLRGDGSLSVATDPPEAAALLYTYTEEKWFLVPADATPLGATPVGRRRLPMGSYLLVLGLEGYRETRVPFVVGRLEDVALSVTLRTEAEIGADLVYVPGGRFVAGSARPRNVEVEDYLIGRFPVTFAEYCEWLDWLERHRPGELEARLPGDTANGLLVRKDDGGRHVPFDPGNDALLDPSMPVFSVCWHDAVAYAQWRSERDGRRYTLPTEDQWEKAARGADGRAFPWGNRFDATLCHMLQSTEARSEPLPIGSYATDDSPYGVRDTAGGVMEWCEDWHDLQRIWRVIRGGSWSSAADFCMTTRRTGADPRTRQSLLGFRLVHVLAPR